MVDGGVRNPLFRLARAESAKSILIARYDIKIAYVNNVARPAGRTTAFNIQIFSCADINHPPASGLAGIRPNPLLRYLWQCQMNKATTVYVLTAAGMIVGLWAILSYGSTLRAAPDVSGLWNLTWDDDGPADGAPSQFRVDQSGIFVTVRIADHALPGKLVRTNHSSGQHVTLNTPVSKAAYRINITDWTTAGETEGNLVCPAFGNQPRHFVAHRPALATQSGPPGNPNATRPDARH